MEVTEQLIKTDLEEWSLTNICLPKTMTLQRLPLSTTVYHQQHPYCYKTYTKLTVR